VQYSESKFCLAANCKCTEFKKPGVKERLVKRARYGDSMSDVVEELLNNGVSVSMSLVIADKK
jgi:hypothetical protein